MIAYGRGPSTPKKKIDGKRRPPSGGNSNGLQKSIRRIYKKIRSVIAQFDYGMYLVAAAAIVLIIVVGFTVWFFTNKNAYDVYLEGNRIGSIKKADDITVESLIEDTVSKITERAGSNVEVKEEIVLTPVHASSKELVSRDYIVSEMSKKFTYRVEAGIITVDGIEMAIVKSVNDANAITTNIISQFLQDDFDIVDKGFVEDVVISSRYVEKEDIISSDQAYSVLTAHKEAERTYTVVKGDTIWGICDSFGISQNDLARLNPTLDFSRPLSIGAVLNLTVAVPVLSVKTVAKETYTEVAEAPVEYLYNPNQPKSYSKVIQQGKDGQKIVTYHKTRVNGFEESREVVDTVYPADPVSQIIEIGTK